MKNGEDYCYVKTLMNMNKHDVNVNGWPGGRCHSDVYLHYVLFLDVLS